MRVQLYLIEVQEESTGRHRAQGRKLWQGDGPQMGRDGPGMGRVNRVWYASTTAHESGPGGWGGGRGNLGRVLKSFVALLLPAIN